MPTDAVHLDTGNGRVRLLVDEAVGARRGDVVLAPVFGGTARSMFAFSRTLCLNGFRVIRVDFRNHVGAGDGAMADTKLSLMAEDLTATAAAYPGATLAAVSLSARPAVRAAAEGADVSGLVLVTPVVHVAATLHAVVGQDFCGADFDVMPPQLDVLDYPVRDTFVHDVLAHDLAGPEATIRELLGCPQPVRLVAGEADTWVLPGDVRAVHDALDGAGRDVGMVTIPEAGHRLNRNPAVAMRYVEATTLACLDLAGADGPAVVPTFDELMRAASAQRPLTRGTIGSPRGERALATASS